jgi:sulfoxide reductase catalytic subunit YedY
MLIRVSPANAVQPSEITPQGVYAERRRFIAQLGLSAIGLGASSLIAGCDMISHVASAEPADATTGTAGKLLTAASKRDFAGGEKPTPVESVTTYNNYYEFGTDKSEPAVYAKTLKTDPWSVTVEGECEAPGTFNLEDFLKPHAIEERIYRHRCVEGWSIVVPWDGIPLAEVLKRFKPTSKAKYVSFFTLYDTKQMPQARRVLAWPYREGLRIDEAMHPLSFLSIGLYGKTLPNQNGAPLRLTVPWKYGFKSIKSIVRIKFVEQMPETTWNFSGPTEYGFYSNVNPEVDHPRWSQKTERRLGELFKRPTLMFNGYSEVASLYTGMDLRTNF